MSFFLVVRGYPNLTKGIRRRPPPSLLRIFAKLGGWLQCFENKMYSFLLKISRQSNNIDEFNDKVRASKCTIVQ